MLPNIDKAKAIELAQGHLKGLNYVDPGRILDATLFTQDEMLAIGMPDTPKVSDRWLVSFARMKTGHALDDVFDSLLVVVDAKSGRTHIQESL